MIIAKNSTFSGSLRAVEYGDFTDFLTNLVTQGSQVASSYLQQQTALSTLEAQQKLLQQQQQAAAAQMAMQYQISPMSSLNQYVPYILIGGSALILLLILTRKKEK